MKNGGELVTFRVADIMSLPLDVAHGCDLVYTDPPWEQGLVKMFETMAQRDAGVDRPGNTIDGLLDRLFSLAPSGIPAFIEYSVKGHERVIAAAKPHGFECTQVHNCVQTNGKPYAVLQFNSGMPRVYGAEGFEVLSHVLAYHRPTQVFEPFAGHGQHTRRMVATGARVIASEFNPARAAKLQEYFSLC